MTLAPGVPVAITPTDLRRWGACYADERVARVYAGRAALTPREVAAAGVPLSHVVWVLAAALVDRRRAFVLETLGVLGDAPGDGWLADRIRLHVARESARAAAGETGPARTELVARADARQIDELIALLEGP